MTMRDQTFDDEMMDRLTNASTLLPDDAKAGFMRSVINRISDLPYQAGPREIEEAIGFVLNCRGIAIGRAAFNRKTKDKVVVRARADRHFFRTGVSK
jgi:hypothetical protein